MALVVRLDLWCLMKQPARSRKASGRALARASSGRRQEPRGHPFGRRRMAETRFNFLACYGDPSPKRTAPTQSAPLEFLKMWGESGARLAEHGLNLDPEIKSG
jgi:hypothetical protein